MSIGCCSDATSRPWLSAGQNLQGAKDNRSLSLNNRLLFLLFFLLFFFENLWTRGNKVLGRQKWFRGYRPLPPIAESQGPSSTSCLDVQPL